MGKQKNKKTKNPDPPEFPVSQKVPVPHPVIVFTTMMRNHRISLNSIDHNETMKQLMGL